MKEASGFVLDARLAADTHVIGDLEVSRLLLMDDARFPWLILVPRRPGLRELTDLAADDQHRLLDEISYAARALQSIDRPHKLNIAALGNVVAQLHVHVVARFEQDEAWPKPVWGVGERRIFADDAREQRLRTLRAALNLKSAT